MTDEPPSYWVAVARMGFDDDFNRIFDDLGISRAELAKRMGCTPAYVSKVLNGATGNYQLETMAKWARAIGAIVQIRLIKEGKEVVRVVDYETAGALDDNRVAAESSEPLRSNILDFHNYLPPASDKRVRRMKLQESESSHG